MHHLNTRFFVFLFILSSFFFLSCMKKPVTKPSPSIVRLNLKSEPLTFDPRKGGDVISSYVHLLLFEGLVRLSEDRSILPGQAEQFHISNDKKVYTFTLRKSFWSDGSKVTAYDFELTWKKILDPHFPAPNAFLFYSIKNAEKAKRGEVLLSEVGVHAKDENTLIVTLEKPTPYFLDLLSFCTFFPISSTKDITTPDWAQKEGKDFICNGPFLIKQRKYNDKIILIKNPLYWDKNRSLPDEIDFSIIENERTALEMFFNQEIDMIGEPLSPLPIDALQKLKKKQLLKSQSMPATTVIYFNTQSPLFSNPKIRKAFSFAINRQAIIENITQMQEVKALNFVSPALKNMKLSYLFPDNDKELARSLFEEGLKETHLSRQDFAKIHYYYPMSDLNHKVAQAIQQQWYETFDLLIPLESFEQKVLLDKLSKRDYHLGQMRWIAQYHDQMSILERFKSKDTIKNFSQWENSKFSELLDISYYQAGKKRLKTLECAEKILADEMPVCPIYHWSMTYIIQPYRNDIQITPIGNLAFEKK